MADVSNRLILSLSNRKAIIFSIYNHVYRIDYREQRSTLSSAVSSLRGRTGRGNVITLAT